MYGISGSREKNDQQIPIMAVLILELKKNG
jgi:hypothetical protein